jgi:uncharacterized RDD family membrane protein YckC
MMENESDTPRSPVPPPPDLPPPSTPAMPPPPDLTPARSTAPPPPDLPPAPPPISPPVQAARDQSSTKPVPLKMDSDDEDEARPGADASFEARVVAAIIDAFVAAGVYLVVSMIADGLAVLVLLAYLLTKDALPFLEGQSIGKKIMKLRAVTIDGKKLTGDWQASIVRNLSLAIPVFGLVELYVLYNRRGGDGPLRRLGDEWAKTKVVVGSEPSGI